VQDSQVTEKEGVIEEKKDLLESFDLDNITEAEFLEKAAERIGTV
jgi:hypothetical protein